MHVFFRHLAVFAPVPQSVFLCFVHTHQRYERQRFGESILKYQEGSVNVQASLSFLNISQKLILQICLALSLSLATQGIRQRIDCCVAHGCDSGVSECCQAIDKDTCPGMEVGDFIAVFTYTVQLFQPLNFLGSVYNAIVMAIVDLTNLSQLLAQNPDIEDTPDAMILPQTNEENEDIAVEFDNVSFHYPTQSPSKGLKGVSFKMRRGTTTAIVGSTGESDKIIRQSFSSLFACFWKENLTLFSTKKLFLERSWKDNYFPSIFSFLRCDWGSCQS